MSTDVVIVAAARTGVGKFGGTLAQTTVPDLGVAGVVVMTAKKADQLGLTPLARIASHASTGLDPATMDIGPVPASQRALQRAGWKAADLDLLEINEAFAAQACAVHQKMGGTRAGSMSTAGPWRSATPLARRAAASSSSPCCINCNAAMPGRPSPPCVLGGAWVSN